MTTFDASTRVIAHQEVSIDDVVRQARHLDITLVGVPLRRGSGERYVDRIRGGLQVVQSLLQEINPSKQDKKFELSLVFGDLHLEHIKSWRDEAFAILEGCTLEYPLWKVPYEQLLGDLEQSQVPCMVFCGQRQGRNPL